MNHLVTTVGALESLFGQPFSPSLMKEIDHLSPHYRAFIEASPFVVAASCGPGGMDCSPRGDAPGFVRVEDERTLLIPDRPGNNRLDSMKNIIADARVALLFLIPGVGETLRVIGRAAISADPMLTQSFAVDGNLPRVVIRVSVQSVYFQCSKSILRSRLWEPETKIDRARLPSVGTILTTLSQCAFDGEAYDREAAERLKQRMY